MPIESLDEDGYSTLSIHTPLSPTASIESFPSTPPCPFNLPEQPKLKRTRLEVHRHRQLHFGLTIRTMILIFTIVSFLVNTAYVILGNTFLAFKIPEILLVGIGIVQVFIVLSAVFRCKAMLKVVAYFLIGVFFLLLITAIFCTVTFIISVIYVSQTNEWPFGFNATLELVKIVLGYCGLWIILMVELYSSSQLMLDLCDELECQEDHSMRYIEV